MKQGRFIVFEGIDGAGKSLQMEKTAQWFQNQGYAVVLTREPGGCPLGQSIRQLLLDPKNENLSPTAELLLYAADRAQHIKELILPGLDQGKIVLSDRYALSTVAYQGYGRNLNMDTIKHLNTIATQGIRADMTIVLDIPQKAAKERILQNRKEAPDRIEQEEDAFFESVRQGYLAESKKDAAIQVVNGNQDPDLVFGEIKALLEKL